jgi:hypothetical protein
MFLSTSPCEKGNGPYLYVQIVSGIYQCSFFQRFAGSVTHQNWCMYTFEQVSHSLDAQSATRTIPTIQSCQGQNEV